MGGGRGPGAAGAAGREASQGFGAERPQCGVVAVCDTTAGVDEGVRRFFFCVCVFVCFLLISLYHSTWTSPVRWRYCRSGVTGCYNSYNSYCQFGACLAFFIVRLRLAFPYARRYLMFCFEFCSCSRDNPVRFVAWEGVACLLAGSS